MGMVYAARDREKKLAVAIKTIKTVSAEALLRFKDEFRALQDLAHPNLVTLGELFEDQGRWFFTMELIEGKDFLDYVRLEGVDHGPTASLDSPAYAVTGPLNLLPSMLSQDPSSQEPIVGVPACFDEARLRASLAQLAEGTRALHSAGKVHRDIKPSNILITDSGRVVLVDFGLVTDSRDGDGYAELRPQGTYAYMAPEQAQQKRVGPAADWYAIGVVLYQALTGRLPFQGTHMEILAKKAHSEPPPPRALCPQVPRDLDALCVALLRTDPDKRPPEKEILRRLSCTGAELPETSQRRPVFVGRKQDLEVLGRAYEESRADKAITLAIHGESGVGKSALVRHFTESLASERHAQVLSGRCYQRESVPYKAIDGIMDTLARILKRLPKIEAVALLPLRASLLCKVFPTLQQVEAFAELQRPAHDQLDPRELRSRLFLAIRELFARLAQHRPLVLCIDDFQWADLDSLALLGDVLRPPQAPPLLLVLTVRTGKTDVAPGRTGNLDVLSHLEGDVRHLYIQNLPPLEAQELATALLSHLGEVPACDAQALADEAEGHPLFLAELVRHLAYGDISDTSHLRLDDALWARVKRLDPGVRFLLELVVVAGIPLAQDVLGNAAELDLGTLEKQCAILRAAHLVRTVGQKADDAFEPYHDRVRESVQAHLDAPLRRRCHERLAVALTAWGRADPEALAMHYGEAGQTEAAIRYTIQAAEAAALALAFEHASRLYRRALALVAKDDPCIPALQVSLADTLANVGQGREAAELYLAAAPKTSRAQTLDLFRRAAEQYLRTGHIDEGLAVVKTVLAEIGLTLYESPRKKLLSLLVRRAHLRLRGLDYRERDESQISPSELRKIDVCFSVCLGLSVVDILGGAEYQARHMTLALDAGEPYRVALAFSAEAAFSAARGGPRRKRTTMLLAESRRLAEKCGHPHALAMVPLTEGVVNILEGRWKSGKISMVTAETLLRDRCTGVTWEINTANLDLVTALTNLGELKELGRRLPQLLREAEARGDRYAMTLFRTGPAAFFWLAKDDPEQARAAAQWAGRNWTQKGLLVQAYLDLLANTEIDLYQGDGLGADNRMRERWSTLKSSLLLGVQIIRIYMFFLRGRAALAAACCLPDASHDGQQFLRAAARDAKRIAREKMPWSDPLALLLSAGVETSRGNPKDAIPRLEAATLQFQQADMALYAAVASHRLGELLGGERGEGLVLGANATMAEMELRNPQRMMFALAPHRSRS
jgi:serine/threonine protein kinase